MRYAVASLLAVAVLCAVAVRAQTQSGGRAAVVVQYPGGRVATRCVSFSESSLTSYDLLRRAGFIPTAQIGPLGAAVCAIDGNGCTNASNCFCECRTPGGSCSYWQFLRQTSAGEWRFSTVGAAATSVIDGGVDGWLWGSGDAQGGQGSLPPITFDQVCNARGTSPQVTKTASSPTPRASAQPRTSATVEPNTGLYSTPIDPSTQPNPTVAVAAASPAASYPPPTPAARPVEAIAAEPTATARPTSREPISDGGTAVATSDAPGGFPASYAAFGLIAAGLVAALAISRRRRS